MPVSRAAGTAGLAVRSPDSTLPPETSTCLDRLFCVGLLCDTDPCIGDEDGQDDDRFDIGGRLVLSFLKVGEDERDSGGREQDQDELILELLEDEFP